MMRMSVPRSSKWVAKLWRSACSVTLFLIPAVSAVSWNRRLNWRVVIGLPGLRPGNSQREFARVHVLDHALAQWADSMRTHGQLLSGLRLTTPQSSRQGASPAIYDLHSVRRARRKPARPRGLSRSDLVLWHISDMTRCPA